MQMMENRRVFLADGENRPVRGDSGANTVTMVCDRMGHRVSKNDQTFIYDGYLQIADNRGSCYIWDPTEPVATCTLVCNNSEFYFYDGNKNVSDILSVTGSLIAHYNYAPFGDCTTIGSNPWRFFSEYFDDDLGLIYYNYRHYEPVMGRWCNYGFIEANNLYSFCSNHSTFEYDLRGLLSQIINESANYAGYMFWRNILLNKSPWSQMIDKWYYEYGDAEEIFGNGTPQVNDIINSIGFQKLVNCAIAAKRGEDIFKELSKCIRSTCAKLGLSIWNPVPLFKDHNRGCDDLYHISKKSKGGNYAQIYDFYYEGDCCACCELP